jgi:hypothetical protein
MYRKNEKLQKIKGKLKLKGKINTKDKNKVKKYV